MKEFSKEHIEINGVDYKLFLNRKGIIAWEKISKISKIAESMKNKYSNLVKDDNAEPMEIGDGVNPFEIAGESVNAIDDIENDEKDILDSYAKLYWIMMYEEHKLNIGEVRALFSVAVEEYGRDALIDLATQMIEDSNTEKNVNDNLKKLEALRPKKK